MTLVFERRQPLVFHGTYDAAEYQVGDVFDVRWQAQLSDGTWALVTQAFYLADLDGRRFVESQVEYMWCRDPNDPGTSEINSDVQYVDHTSDVSGDPRVLAEQAVETTPEEWVRYKPCGAPRQ